MPESLDPARVAEAQAVIYEALALLQDRLQAAGLEPHWEVLPLCFVVTHHLLARPWHVGSLYVDSFPDALAGCDRLIAEAHTKRDADRAKHPTAAEVAAMLGVEAA